MSGLPYFFWLAGEALVVGPVLFPGLTLLAIAGVVLAVGGARGNKDVVRTRSLWLLLPFAIPLAILVFGVVFVYDGPVWSAPAWRGAMISVLISLHLPVAAVLLWRLWTIRWVVVGVSAVQTWYSLCAGFMAGMSVTNVWL